MANQVQAMNLFWGEKFNITLPNHAVSIPIVQYQKRLLDLLHASKDNPLIFTESL